MKLDQASLDLMAAARYIEVNGYAEVGMNHPLNAVARITKPYNLGDSSPQRRRYSAAADRLHNACGLDNMDLSPEEAIDSLVAAAFWEIP